MTLISTIEALLFITHKPLTKRELSQVTGVSVDELATALLDLRRYYEERAGGLVLLESQDRYQLVTSPSVSEVVQKFVKSELTGELTKPSLETLTVVAYRGPISKAELELIRGVNCSLILRNLLMRGLVEAKEDKTKGTLVYSVTVDLLKFLGLTTVEDLPDYDQLNRNNNLDKLLATLTDSNPGPLSEVTDLPQ